MRLGDLFIMGVPELINQEAILRIINDEVEKLATKKLEEFRNELAQSYYFDDYLIDRVAASIKLDVSLRQVDTLVKTGKLKKCAIGRSVKFRNSDVLAYMSALK